MCDDLLTNLEILRARFDDAAALARSILDEHREGLIGDDDLAWLLRHHRSARVVGRDTRRRDSFDELLSMYALVEIACLIRRVPRPLPEEFARVAHSHLNNPSLRVYYETHYPLLLPTSFRLRLDGTHDLTEEGSRTESAFVAFLDLNATIEDDLEVELFLWMLDDGKARGDRTRLRDLRGVLADRERFREMISRTPVRENVTWRSARLIDAVRGLGKFLTFCTELEALLDFAGETTMLRSAMWHYHSYWFGLLRKKIGVELAMMVEQFGEWLPEQTGEDERRLSQDSVSDMARRLRRLSSDEFHEPLGGAIHAFDD